MIFSNFPEEKRVVKIAQCPKQPKDLIGTCDIKTNSCIKGKLISTGKDCPAGTKCCPWGCQSLCLGINIKLPKKN